MLLEHDKIKKIIDHGNDLCKQFVAINEYQFKEDSLEYFFIKQNDDILNNDFNTISVYHDYTLSLLRQLIDDLDQVNDQQGIANRIKERMVMVANSIDGKLKKPIFKFDVQKYFHDYIKKIIEVYVDYFDYLQSQIEHKNQEVVYIIEMLNSFFQKINVYTVTSNDGDQWDELKFDPEINVTDNVTNDENKIDNIHKVYRYCYLIDYNTKGNSYILYPGKASIWKGE